MATLNKICDRLESVTDVLLVVMVVAMLVFGTMQVFCRYVLGASLSWSEEAMRYLYVWATMFGIVTAVRHNTMSHINSLIDFIEKKTKTGKLAITILCYGIQIALFLILVIYGISLCKLTMGQHSPSMYSLYMGYVYLCMPIGGAMCMLCSIEALLNTITRLKQTSSEGGATQ